MTMNDIRNILAIAEHGRITKAAHALYISQPSLSQCLQKVENELGVRLFERNRFGECKPTEAGRIFIEEGTEILVHWKSMVDHLHGQKEKKDFTIGIPIRTGMEVVKGNPGYHRLFCGQAQLCDGGNGFQWGTGYGAGSHGNAQQRIYHPKAL